MNALALQAIIKQYFPNEVSYEVDPVCWGKAKIELVNGITLASFPSGVFETSFNNDFKVHDNEKALRKYLETIKD